MININMNKARDVKRNQIRQERAPLLAKLDVEVMRNITNAEKLAEIEAEKQRLRDATKDPRIEEVETVEDLKALTVL